MALGISTVTLPLTVEGNRPFVDLTLRGPKIDAVSARFWLDTGGGGFLLTESMAKSLGIEWGDPFREEGAELARAADAPTVSVGGFEVELDLDRVFVVLDRDNLLPPVAPGHADGLFPGHLLAQHHVVFDYPAESFTIARPGLLTPIGERLPMPVAEVSGFPRTEVVIAGAPYGFLLDTGASFTLVSEVLLKGWAAAHADWQLHDGAYGEAVTLGSQTLKTLIVPSATWGQFAVPDVGVASQSEGTFEQWMSSMMAKPIVGALAGNVLKRFRIELDYANEALYLASSQ